MILASAGPDPSYIRMAELANKLSINGVHPGDRLQMLIEIGNIVSYHINSTPGYVEWQVEDHK